MSEYKPFLVIYSPSSVIDDIKSRIFDECKRLEEETGYNILLIPTNEQPRAEIISVDKATVVEDIQKYIDLKFEENESKNKEITRN